MLGSPLLIGSLRLPNRVLLAPLAGVSDAPFRRICQEMGAGLTFVEMLAAVAVLRGNRRTREMRARRSDEEVLGVQLTGTTPDEVARAVAVLDGEGYDAIDINMGCPVRKVVATGCGSGFLRDPDRLSATVAAARAATTKPLSAKCRLGFDRASLNVVDTAERVVRAGLDMLTVHGRTRSERYDTGVDLGGIADAVRASRAMAGPGFVVAGNGDVLDRASAHRMVAVTGCDAVMVSRGAIGNPWIFRQIVEGRPCGPQIAEWVDVVLRHLDYQGAMYGTGRRGAIVFRKHLVAYAKGFPGSRRLRDVLNTVASIDEAKAHVRDFARLFPPTLRRFEDHEAEEAALVPVDPTLRHAQGDLAAPLDP